MNPNEIIGASIIFSIFIFSTTFFFLILFNIFISFVISTMFALFSYIYLKNRLIFYYDKIRIQIIFGTELAFQDLLLMLKTNHSILDGIELIANGAYPVISSKFQEILKGVNNGEDPEILLWNFAETQPSNTLKERIQNLLSNNFKRDLITDFLELNYVEKQAEYKRYTKELESKLIFLIGLCIFLPFIITLFLSFYGLAANAITIILIPIIIMIFIFIRSKLFKTSLQIFGEIDVFSPNLQRKKWLKMNREFLDLTEFLLYFANSLKRYNSEEKAYTDALKNSSSNILSIIDTTQDVLLKNGHSFEDFWHLFSVQLQNPHSKKLVSLVQRMLRKSSRETGIRLISILTQLKINQQLTEERLILLKAQHFKVRFLCIVLSGVLGMLTSISPLLYYSFQIFQSPNLSSISLNLFHIITIWPLYVFLLSMTLFTALFLADVVNLDKKFFNSFISFLIYILTVFIFSIFLY
ncbi:MAG: hypothetical protein ACTSSI_00100 [Candidatus Helarchaeota archaeon]